MPPYYYLLPNEFAPIQYSIADFAGIINELRQELLGQAIILIYQKIPNYYKVALNGGEIGNRKAIRGGFF